MAEGGFAICAYCGERVGVYEPIVVVDPGGSRTTSLAREQELEPDRAPVMHADCAVAARSGE
jgi:hypothetical protein